MQIAELSADPKSLKAFANSQGSKSKIKSGIKESKKLTSAFKIADNKPKRILLIKSKINANKSGIDILGMFILIGNNLNFGMFKSGKLQKSKFLMSQAFKKSDHSSK